MGTERAFRQDFETAPDPRPAAPVPAGPPVILALADRYARDSACIEMLAALGSGQADRLSDIVVATERAILRLPAASLLEAAVQLAAAHPWVEVLKDPGSDLVRDEAAANLESALLSAIAVLVRSAGEPLPAAIADRFTALRAAGAAAEG